MMSASAHKKAKAIAEKLISNWFSFIKCCWCRRWREMIKVFSCITLTFTFFALLPLLPLLSLHFLFGGFMSDVHHSKLLFPLLVNRVTWKNLFLTLLFNACFFLLYSRKLFPVAFASGAMIEQWELPMRVFVWWRREWGNQLQIVFSCWTFEVGKRKNSRQERGRREVFPIRDLMTLMDVQSLMRPD